MNPLHQRWLMFLIGCIGSRAAFAAWAKSASPSVLPYLGAVALLPAIGFWYLYLTGQRKTGPEVLGGRIWWNNLRPLHGTLYAVFAVLALFGVEQAWMILAIDVLFGFSAFAYHHWILPYTP